MDEQNLDSTDDFEKIDQNKETGMDIEKEHTSFNMPPNTSYTEKKSGASKLLVLILSLIVLVLVGGTLYLFRDRIVGGKDEKPSPTPIMKSPVVEETPEPTPTPVDRSGFKIRVLNGTKTSGLASDVSSKLKDLGYVIDKTGNATNSAFAKTQVRVKADSNTLLDQLIKDLSPDYSASGSASLKDSDTVDAEVILGKE